MNNEIDLFEIEIDEEENAITIEETAIENQSKLQPEKLSKGFYIRCSESEWKEIEALASTFNMSISRLFVARMLNIKSVLSREEMQIFSKIMEELSAIGNNVNQIAIALNATRLKGETMEITQKYLFTLANEAKSSVTQFKSETKKRWQF
jgi:hypothetical protein